MQMILKVNDVWKKYPGKWALKGVTFGVEKGKVLGVLGENGAGKSTLFRIIASVTRPTRGNVTVLDNPAGLHECTLPREALTRRLELGQGYAVTGETTRRFGVPNLRARSIVALPESKA